MDDIYDFEQWQNQRQRELSKSYAAHADLGKYIHDKHDGKHGEETAPWAKLLGSQFIKDTESQLDPASSTTDPDGVSRLIDALRSMVSRRDVRRPANHGESLSFKIEVAPVTPEEKNNREKLRTSLAKQRAKRQKSKLAELPAHNNQATATSITDRMDCNNMDRGLLRKMLRKEREQEMLMEQQRNKT